MSTRTPFVFVKCCFGGPRSFPPFALFSMLLPDISCLAPVGGLPVQRIVCSNKCFAPRTPLSNKQRARTEHQVRFKTTAHILFLRSPILKIFKPKPSHVFFRYNMLGKTPTAQEITVVNFGKIYFQRTIGNKTFQQILYILCK